MPVLVCHDLGASEAEVIPLLAEATSLVIPLQLQARRAARRRRGAWG